MNLTSQSGTIIDARCTETYYIMVPIEALICDIPIVVPIEGCSLLSFYSGRLHQFAGNIAID